MSNTETVQMTAEERRDYEAYKAERMKQAAEEKLMQDRETYKQLIDETVNDLFPKLESLSGQLSALKKEAFERFHQALLMKQELYDGKADNKSNAFIDKEQKRRIILGRYEIDSYDDTVNEGIGKVKAYIESLAKDKESAQLVKFVMSLLVKDKNGNLKPSRVLQLRKMADERGNEQFLDGVRIIQAAYHPTVSKFFVRAEKKNEQGEWVAVPLGITES